MYLPAAAILAVLALVLSSNKAIGPRRAIWLLWWPAWLLPSYSVFYVGPIEVTLPTVAGTMLIATNLVFGSRERSPWIPSDYLMLGLIACGGVSELMAGAGIGTCFEVARRWGVPYILGRMAISPNEGETTIPNSVLAVTCLVCVGAACISVFEALTHVNPYWALFGHNWEFMVRYGIRRANGPAVHSIAFGMTFVCLLPWAMEAARRARLRIAPGWWGWVPVVTGAGLVCTVSRGSWGAAVVSLGALLYLQRPRLRSRIVFSLIVGTVLAWNYGADVVAGINAMAGKDETSTELTIYIDGESYNYTGTNHRVLQFLAFRVPIEQTGLFGHGTLGMERLGRGMRHEEFVPGIPPGLPSTLASMDSHYLLTILKNGWVGIGLWIAVSVCSLRNLITIRNDEDLYLRQAVAGSIVGIMLGLLTVYSHEPFESLFVFALGLSGAWKVRSSADDDMDFRQEESQLHVVDIATADSPRHFEVALTSTRR